ncbi:hypothetical protein K488DRAFT_61869 [Vararia minispora EC-137]|uniref:Uncharacterized protein n=1 Tax=Vararia minispora EC-137 TaxID=1314806 RepID=A0ACB8Q719_9AGAM|nr:hypothetical protein K488DRAFT_61869 [Vararia minispora EC-137]
MTVTSDLYTLGPVPATVSQDASASATIGTPAATPAPLVKPSGGIGFDSPPAYRAQTDFDYQSLYLGLHQELLELDAFLNGPELFSESDFEAAGLDAENQFLLRFMGQQEIGHATLIASMIGWDQSLPQCQYRYPNYTSVRDYVDDMRRVTRYGESGTIGFLGHLNAQDTAAMVNDAIQTEGRQQLIFRQWEGLFPMPFWQVTFTTSITQSMQWTLMAPYIANCPADLPRVNWTAFPALDVTNNPSLENKSGPGITSNLTQFTAPGRQVQLSWDASGKTTGWNNSYTTQSYASGNATWAAWISQLNTTYTPLHNVSGNTGFTIQPGGGVYGDGTASVLNGSVYLLVTDADPYVTPYNLSEIESHIIAGPALYNVG